MDRSLPTFSWAVAAVLMAVACGAVLPAQDWVPRQMSPSQHGPGVRLEPQVEASGSLSLAVRIEGQRQVLPVPFGVLTKSCKVDGGYLLAGISPSGSGLVVALERRGDQLALLPQSLSLESAVPFSLGMGSGLLVVWLADGRILAAEPADLWDFPSWNSFELVGHAAVKPNSFAEFASVQVPAKDRIRVQVNPRARHREFRLGTSGVWGEEGVAEPRHVGRLEVRVPVVIGGSNALRTNLAGPLFLSEEGVPAQQPLAQDAVQGQWVDWPSGVSDLLRADRRYRLLGAGIDGRWFYPVKLAGSAWATPGLRLSELRVHEHGVRIESGSATFHANLDVMDKAAARALGTRLVTVCSLAETPGATPDLVERGGRVWLVPTAIATLSQPVDPDLAGRSHALAMPVPLTRGRSAAGSWLHVQFLVRSATGDVVGATAVRSVPILPDAGTLWAPFEAARHDRSSLLWLERRIVDVEQYWLGMTGS